MNSYNPNPDTQHNKNMFLALVLCAFLIMGWQYFVEVPKRQKLAEWQKQQSAVQEEEQARINAQKAFAEVKKQQDQEPEIEVPAPRITINSDTLHGSLSLKGLRFDTLTLAEYKETRDEGSPEVELLKSTDDELPYFMQFGWLSDDPNLRVPDSKSIWQADGQSIAPHKPLKLEWYNGEGVTFYATITLDEDYMFTIEQQVLNQGGKVAAIKPYALINRAYAPQHVNYLISHEGPLAVAENQLQEIGYDDLVEQKQSFTNSAKWLGFTDKYWLTALIPDQSDEFIANFSSYTAKSSHGLPSDFTSSAENNQRYQADYVGPTVKLVDGERSRSTLHFFAGAKKVDILDRYTAGVADINLEPVPLFDRAVDFGWLYFLTKPIFKALHFFYELVGNFGVAIILLTLCIKLAMFPLANKGYKSMTALKALQPEMTRLKEQYGDDRMKFQQELLAVYKKEKVNPASGCLPMLIQLPVFFALYKVLFVTIEMRHAPFFGPWQDLSHFDPTNIFTAFGLLEWNHPAFLMLGILPILMSLSMMIQMSLQPTPQDPVQAKVMKWMPWMLMLIVARMPAGLVLYWVVSNVLSILQQWVIMRKYKAANPDKDEKKA